MKAFLVNQQMSFPLRSINLFFLVSSFLNTFVFATQHLCHPDQRDTLLEFKNEFGIQEPAWVNNTDCCSWDGITCDAGEVIGLDLSSSFLHGKLQSNSSLFRLRHLRDLNLSNSSLTGQIPTKLLQLTKLVSLDLSSNSFSVDESFLPLLARNLRNLRELDMSSMNISSEIPHEFSNMQSLRLLHLSDCKLFGEFPNSVLLIPSLQSISLSQNPNLKGNLPDFRENNSLLELSISYTAFSGTIPDSISNLKHLTSLILTKSSFVGEIPSSIGNLKQLTTFYVGYNKLSGNLPAEIVNLTQLRSLFLSSNQFTGSLPPNISQLSKLEYFYAEDNSFTGPILPSLLKISSLSDVTLSCNHINDFVGFENISLLPNLQWFHVYHDNSKMVGPLDLNVFSPLKKLNTLSLNGIFISTENITPGSDFLSNLEYLYLRGCNITEFPDFIRNQRNLHSLDLANNTIKGQVPDWLWRLPKLVALDLSGNSLNSFNGSLKASPKSQINRVDLSSNAFQGPLFIPSMSLHYFVVSKNNFTGEIPRSICGQSSLEVLDLSNNNLHGSIPRCLETLMSSLSDLNLSNNSLSGILPEIFVNATNLRTLDISQNRMEGQLPASLTGCSALEVLNVGSNRINDMFPFQLSSLQKLQVLVLRSNKFHGTLHKADGVWFGFAMLKIIDVSHNDFFGILPSDYFLNWTMMSSNRDDNMGPEYITNPNIRGYYTSLVLMSKGVSMEMERILTIYTAIDFSGNQIHGYIPDSIGLLKELLILNISSNAFTGHIPSSLANLTNLESLDLSQNKISGEIPPELGTLSSLEWVNISHNQLVGSIPQGTQFQRQKCSSYEGNPGLYGPSLKDVCGDKKSPTPPQPDPLDTEEEEEEESLSWIAAGIGFAPGVIFGLTIGYVVSSYKHYQNFWPKTFHKDVHEDFWSNHLTEYQNSLAHSSIKLPPSKHRCSVQI